MSRKHHATVRDVAALAGVSTATVSRCFDPACSQLVTAETRQRVLDAAARLHYRVNHVARSLKTKSTKTIAVIAPELSNDFFMELTEAMDQVLERYGYTLLVASASNSVEEEKNDFLYLRSAWWMESSSYLRDLAENTWSSWLGKECPCCWWIG